MSRVEYRRFKAHLEKILRPELGLWYQVGVAPRQSTSHLTRCSRKTGHFCHPNFSDRGGTKIIVTGTVNIADPIAVVRYHTDGQLDASFGTSGIARVVGVTAFVFIGFSPPSSALQTDGKLVVSGIADGMSNAGGIARLNENGSLDSSFHTDGALFVSGPSAISVFDNVFVRPDGKIVGTGMSFDAGQGPTFIARANTDGSLDTGFNRTGYLLDTLFRTPELNGAALQAEDKLLKGFSEGGIFSVRRYWS